MSPERGPTLALRADAGPALGTGHLVRALALAAAWRARGGRAVLISQRPDPRLRARVLRHADAWLALDEHGFGALDAEGALQLARKEGAPALALDGYAFDARYQGALRAGGLVLTCVDDLAHLPAYEVDVLVNGNAYARELPYRAPAGALRLLGCEYALLRPEFRAARERARSTRAELHAVVTLGGADAAGATERVLDGLGAAAAFRAGRLHASVVAGAQNDRRAALEHRVAALGAGARLLADVGDMAALLADADLAVSAAGTTTLELACLGVPAALVVVAENQRRIAEAMSRLGVALSLGALEALTPERVAAAVDELAGAGDRRARMGRSGRALVDGRGAERVAEAMARRIAERGAS